LKEYERSIVFDGFRRYHHIIFEQLEVLDSDDVALSLLGRLRTPIWELKRRVRGFDYVFVDEAQLFNENERRVFPLLTRGDTTHVPIVLALDEAQDIYGQTTAGLATLGITDVTSESLSSIHRSTQSIVRLAFFVIQRSTDLFGPDFPDFTGIAERMEPDSHPLAAFPRIEVVADAQRSIGRFVLRRIRRLRKANLWQIAVICHAEMYWEALVNELGQTDLPLVILEKRGERIAQREPVVVLSRPAHVGGQEFDAVVLVGLELGVVPPRVTGNDALATAVEQQALREIYLAITRARYQVAIVLPPDAAPSPILHEAEKAGLIRRENSRKHSDIES
jgi:superfamily I DNA/RNA helicase